VAAHSVLRKLDAEAILRRCAEVVCIEAEALSQPSRSIDHSFADACEAIYAANGRVVIMGMGKSGLIAREFADLPSSTASDIMAPDPKTVHPHILVEEALQFLNDSRITCAFVMNREAPVNTHVPVGVVHVHDFLRIGLA
jgi:hypothetical protein